MRNGLRVFLASLSVALPVGSEVATAADPSDFEIWSPLTASGPLGDTNWRASFEFQSRFSDNATKLSRGVIRPAIGRYIGSGITVYQGYGYTPAFQNSSFQYNWKNEHRLYQEVRGEHRLSNNWPLLNRFRLEERFIDGAGGEPSLRARHQGKVIIPVDGPLSFGISNEFFLNLNDTDSGPKQGFDQNRAAATLIWKTDYGFTYEGGYVHNWVHRANRLDQQNHILQLSISYKWG